MRGSTAIYGSVAASGGYETFYVDLTGVTGMTMYTYVNFSYLDSPSTTSATTYKTQASCSDTSSSGQSRTNQGGTYASLTLLEIGA